MQKIYFDNAATTPVDQEVVRIMADHLSHNFGNPSSTHEFGRKARAQLEMARKNISGYLNCAPSEVIFTAGGSEADNLILYNAVKNLGVKRILSSSIEHHAVLHTINALEKDFSIESETVPLDEQGQVNFSALESLLQGSEKKTLISLMQVNNELGNILEVDKVIDLCSKYGAFFHSDTVQGIGHVPLDLKKSPIDFIAASAHKFHGPKGVGFAIIPKRYKIEPLLHGGEQERGARAGTENTHSIAGMDKALQLVMDNFEKDKAYISGLKNYFIEQIRLKIKDIAFNGLSGDTEKSAFHILNVRFPRQIPMLLFNLDLKGIAASGGSACQSGSNKGSHVLGAILGEEAAKQTSVRFSFSKFNTKEEIDYTMGVLEALCAEKSKHA